MGNAKIVLADRAILTKRNSRIFVKPVQRTRNADMLTSATVRNKSGLSSVTILFVRPP